jgi:hypothetical protein
MEINKKTNKKIDIFIISSIVFGIFSVCGFFIFAGGSVWESPVVLSKLIHYQRTWEFFSIVSLTLMIIGVFRSKVKENTRHLGFSLTILIVAVESFFAFGGIAALALIVVVVYISTYKWWAK